MILIALIVFEVCETSSLAMMPYSILRDVYERIVQQHKSLLTFNLKWNLDETNEQHDPISDRSSNVGPG